MENQNENLAEQNIGVATHQIENETNGNPSQGQSSMPQQVDTLSKTDQQFNGFETQTSNFNQYSSQLREKETPLEHHHKIFQFMQHEQQLNLISTDQSSQPALDMRSGVDSTEAIQNVVNSQIDSKDQEATQFSPQIENQDNQQQFNHLSLNQQNDQSPNQFSSQFHSQTQEQIPLRSEVLQKIQIAKEGYNQLLYCTNQNHQQLQSNNVPHVQIAHQQNQSNFKIKSLKRSFSAHGLNQKARLKPYKVQDHQPIHIQKFHILNHIKENYQRSSIQEYQAATINNFQRSTSQANISKSNLKMSRKKTLKYVQLCIQEESFLDAMEIQMFNLILFGQEYHKPLTIQFYQLLTVNTIYLSIILLKNIDKEEYKRQHILQMMNFMITKCEQFNDFMISHLSLRLTQGDWGMRDKFFELKQEKIILKMLLSKICLLYGQSEEFLYHQKLAFAALDELKSYIRLLPQVLKLSHTWLKNSLLLDFISYELTKTEGNSQVKDQIAIIQKSVKKQLSKKSNKVREQEDFANARQVQKQKLGLLLETIQELESKLTENSLSTKDVLEIVYHKLCKDFYTPSYVFTELEVERLFLILQERGFQAHHIEAHRKVQKVQTKSLRRKKIGSSESKNDLRIEFISDQEDEEASDLTISPQKLSLFNSTKKERQNEQLRKPFKTMEINQSNLRVSILTPAQKSSSELVQDHKVYMNTSVDQSSQFIQPQPVFIHQNPSIRNSTGNLFIKESLQICYIQSFKVIMLFSKFKFCICLQILNQQAQQDLIFQELSRLIRLNKEKELALDHEKHSMDGCFEAMIVKRLGLNRNAMYILKKRPKPIYQPFGKQKEEIEGFKAYFRLKRELHEGNFDRKALGTWEHIHAFMFSYMIRKKRAMQREEREFLQNLKRGYVPEDFDTHHLTQDNTSEEGGVVTDSESESEESQASSQLQSPIKDTNSTPKRDNQQQQQIALKIVNLNESSSNPRIKFIKNSASAQKESSLRSSIDFKKTFQEQPQLLLSQQVSKQSQFLPRQSKTQSVLNNSTAQKKVVIKNRIEMKKLHDAFKRRQGLSKDIIEAKSLQQTLIQNLNFQRKTLIDTHQQVQQQQSGSSTQLNVMKQKLGDLLKYELQNDGKKQKRLLDPQQSTKIFLNTIKKDIEENYWQKLIQNNKKNHAFREAFTSFIPPESPVEKNQSNALTQLFGNRKQSRPKFLNRLLQAQNDGSEIGSQNGLNRSSTSLSLGGSNMNKKISQAHLGHDYLENLKFQTIQESSNQTLEGFLHKRDKQHKDSIKDTLQQRQEDMNQMVKDYNQSKGIFDQEDMREMQSAQQRRNLTKILHSVGEHQKLKSTFLAHQVSISKLGRQKSTKEVKGGLSRQQSHRASQL